VLAWPENGKVTIKSLAAGSSHAPGQIERVELFTMGAPWGGDAGSANLQFTRTADGLVVSFPEKKQTEYVAGVSTQVKVPRDLKAIRLDVTERMKKDGRRIDAAVTKIWASPKATETIRAYVARTLKK